MSPKMAPGAMAVATVILRWPDRKQPQLYITGFKHVGEIESSHVFRDLPQRDEAINPEKELLGDPAEVFINEMESQPPSRFAEEITSQSEEELEKGYADGLYTRQQLDDLYGAGGWRPMPRFMVQQGCGKLRCIDDGARGLHNAATGSWETIFTTSFRLYRRVYSSSLGVYHPDVLRTLGRMARRRPQRRKLQMRMMPLRRGQQKSCGTKVLCAPKGVG